MSTSKTEPANFRIFGLINGFYTVWGWKFHCIWYIFPKLLYVWECHFWCLIGQLFGLLPQGLNLYHQGRKEEKEDLENRIKTWLKKHHVVRRKYIALAHLDIAFFYFYSGKVSLFCDSPGDFLNFFLFQQWHKRFEKLWNYQTKW